jgi:eukaryotic-like serine/threonine-protein kinase
VIANRYRLLDRLGAGGMSVVWRAHDEVLDREVAVKVLSAELAADPDLLDRIQVEARAAARLHHPNVVEVHDYGETDGSLPYVVMELVDGRSLADLLTAGALPWQVAVLVCAQVAAALAAAHARGIVHRDIKPSNVMVTSSGVKLVDFGISATVGEADAIAGEVLGTPAYLAPERLAAGQVRPATDVYALGLMLYLTLCGRLPWEASTTTQMLKAHRYLEPARLPPVPGLPAEVAALCRRCLAKDPADRPDAAEAASVLAGAAGVVSPPPLLPTEVAAPVPAPTTTLIRIRSRGRVVAAAGAAVFVLVAMALWLGSRSDPPTAQAMAKPQATAAPLQCTVRYAIRSALNGRFSTAVTILNTGTVPAANWQLSFTLPDGQKLVRGTGWRQDGQSLRVNGSGLAAGASTSSGFDATYRGASTLPSQFRLNETVCAAQLSVAGRTVASSSPRPTRIVEATTVRADKGNPGKGKGPAKPDPPGHQPGPPPPHPGHP